MKTIKLAMVTALATLSLASAANATVSVSATPGCASYCGPLPITYDFDGSVPLTLGGGIVGPGTTEGQFAQPLGSEGHYYSVGPSTNSPGTVTIGNGVSMFSFIWGSLDEYNTLVLTTSLGDYTYTGSQIAALVPGFANGDQTGTTTNPIVTFLLTGGDQDAVSINLSSTQNAFEIDSISVASVPEPATWAMMLIGFGAVGYSMRRRKVALPQIA
jgi:PEP-CTERM motif-containing protein